MEHLILKRIWQDSQTTLGMFIFDSIKLCDSLEPHSIFRLKAGIYDLIVTPSPNLHYDVLYICTPAPQKGFEIHRGNTVHDTKGCPLAGWLNPKLVNTLRFSTEGLNILVSLYEKKIFSSLQIIDI
jgi:hypothetical protein